MNKIEENVNLKAYNTFGINATARYFTIITDEDELRSLLQTDLFHNEKVLILGEGSNLLFTKDFDGLVIKADLKGIHIVDENDDVISVRAMSGECWHDLVVYCVNHHWGGIQNLSLIPGTVGAAPIQNIGAYGIELREVVKEVSGIDLISGEAKSFLNHECAFGYRESIFKHELKEKFFISSVTLRLTKKNHVLRTHYGAIQNILDQQKITSPTLRDISNAVIHIRSSKLPDPKQIGNAGSFFKNPSITQAQFRALHERYPEMPSYPSENQLIKVPAGWLIEQCGWKGKRAGRAGVHHQQALVLVNHGDATGAEIFSLAKQILHDVREKFSIDITTEVNIIGNPD